MMWRLVVVTLVAAALAVPASAMAPPETWTETVDLLDRHASGDAGPDGSVIVGGRQSTFSPSETAGFVRRIDAGGTEMWRAEIGSPGAYDGVLDLTANADGLTYAIGETRGDVEGANAGDLDTFVRAFSATGATRWTDQFGTLDSDSGRAIAVATDGSVYAAGSTNGALAAGGGGGEFDGFIRKYSSTGNVLWTIEFGGPDDDIVSDVTVADDGTVWVVGHSVPVGSGITDGFITRVSSGGFVLSTDNITADFAGTTISKAWGVASHPSGGVVVGGELINTVDSSGFLRRYAASGSQTWSTEVRGAGVGTIFGLDIGADGTVFIVGIPTTAVFEEGFFGAYSSDGTFQWADESTSSNQTFVVATTDGGILVHGSSVLSSPGELTRLGGSGGSGGGTFTDVPAGAFYAEAVEWLKAEGITTGTSPTTYSPDAVVTRGQMAAFLHRLVGEPGGSGPHGFSDVPAGAFYADAVAWLKAQGITTGTSPTTYSPDAVVTRGQMAAFLWRLAGMPGGSPAHGFSDVPEGAFYADAVAWLKAQGITTGTSATTYSPDAVVTRGQMAAFLFRMATDSDWVRPT